jgi:hypothetical protein
VLTLGFNPNSAGGKTALLSITDTGGSQLQIPVSGTGTQAVAAPYLANWEAVWMTGSSSRACQNAWHSGTAVSYRDQGALYISSDGGQSHQYQGNSPARVYAFRDLVIQPTDAPDLKLALCSDINDCLSIWLLPTNLTPVAETPPWAFNWVLCCLANQHGRSPNTLSLSSLRGKKCGCC